MNTSIKVHQTFLRINMHDGIIAQVFSKIKRIFQFDALSALRAPNVGRSHARPCGCRDGRLCAEGAQARAAPKRRSGFAPAVRRYRKATLERSLAAS